MRIHNLKILPEYFEAVDSGAKPFEVRFNDRDFKIGDRLCLREYSDGEYTGRVLHREISYVLDSPEYCKEDFVVLGLAPIEREGGTSEEKQIEEMAYSVCRLKNKPKDCASCMWKVTCNEYLSAESYYNAGYRK